MKRLFFISITAVICSVAAFSQTVFDALKSADSDLNGTARYSSMAGAFGALGGDASAIKDNPAGLGVFRKSEVSITGGYLWQNSTSIWKSELDGKIKIDTANAGINKFGLNNISMVLASPLYRTSGLVSSNFSFAYNKLKNFNRIVYAKSPLTFASITDFYIKNTPVNASGDIEFDNGNYSWNSVMAYKGYLINPVYDDNSLSGWSSVVEVDEQVAPDYKLQESGGINEYAFSWAGNISNRFFIGVSLNIRSIDYRLYSIYNEDFTNGGGMTMHNNLDITGSGVNANFGVIYVPSDFLRIGASVQSPTAYSLSMTNYAELDYDSYDYDMKKAVSGTVKPTDRNGNTEINKAKTNLQTPFKANGSVAFLFGKKGLISAEYVYQNYTGMSFAYREKGIALDYSKENNEIKSMLNSTSSFKIGGEYKITDNFAVRAGYAYIAPTTNERAQNIPYINTVRTDIEYFVNNGANYFTAGLGYRDANWYFDAAFTSQRLKETFYAYNLPSVMPANITTCYNNLTLTLGIRF